MLGGEKSLFSRQHRYFLQKYFHAFVTSKGYSAFECPVFATAQIHSDLIPPTTKNLCNSHMVCLKKREKPANCRSTISSQ